MAKTSRGVKMPYIIIASSKERSLSPKRKVFGGISETAQNAALSG